MEKFTSITACDKLMSLDTVQASKPESPGGGGYLGQFLLGMCRWPLRTPTPL